MSGRTREAAGSPPAGSPLWRPGFCSLRYLYSAGAKNTDCLLGVWASHTALLVKNPAADAGDLRDGALSLGGKIP